MAAELKLYQAYRFALLELALPLLLSTALYGQNTFPASGNVGIGTTAPQSLLHVYGGDIAVDNTTATDTQLRFLKAGTLSSILYRPGSTDDLRFYLGGGDKVAILSSGNVGIGTTNPNGPLTIKGSGAGGTGQLELFDSSGSYLAYIGTESRAGSIITGDSVGDLSVNQMTPHNIVFTTNNGTPQLVIQSGGNIGIGSTSPGAKLEVDGNVKLTSGSGASLTFADGTVQSTAFTGVLCGGDFAESVNVTGTRAVYEPGDVLVIDSQAAGKFAKSGEPYSTAVLGIYSTRPGVVGRRLTTPKSADEVPLAMVGIVPTKVSAENGPIKPGDLLVTASIPGFAMKGTDRNRMLGAVIGKALGTLKSGTGVIEVGVTLQ